MKPDRPYAVALIAACLVVLAATARAQDDNAAARRLDELWAARGADPTLRESVAIATRVLTEEPKNFEAVWRVARAIRWLALTQADEAEKRQLATRAMRWGQRAIKLRPDRVEGHFYYMMAVGEYGNTLSIPRALYEGIGSKFERAGLTAYKIDRGFEDGEVITALGRFYFVLPWPKRDLAKARRFLEEGAQNYPQILMNFVYLAELEYEEGHPDKARAALERVLQPAAPVSRTEEQSEARALARSHLEKWFPSP